MDNKRFTRPLWYKTATFDIKGLDEESRTVSGYLSAFNHKDLDGDVILKGAFTKSIDEHGPASQSPQKIAFLYQHDLKEPLGRFTTLTEDDFGLYFEAELDTTARASQVIKQYQSGTLNQHSIGFRYIPDKVKYDETSEAWYISEVRLLEGSVVTIGANENTPFMGMKASELTITGEQLVKETEEMLKELTAEQAYEARKIIAKHIALAENEPPRALVQSKPQDVDWHKIINNLKQDS